MKASPLVHLTLIPYTITYILDLAPICQSSSQGGLQASSAALSGGFHLSPPAVIPSRGSYDHKSQSPVSNLF